MTIHPITLQGCCAPVPISGLRFVLFLCDSCTHRWHCRPSRRLPILFPFPGSNARRCCTCVL